MWQVFLNISPSLFVLFYFVIRAFETSATAAIFLTVFRRRNVSYIQPLTKNSLAIFIFCSSLENFSTEKEKEKHKDNGSDKGCHVTLRAPSGEELNTRNHLHLFAPHKNIGIACRDVVILLWIMFCLRSFSSLGSCIMTSWGVIFKLLTRENVWR